MELGYHLPLSAWGVGALLRGAFIAPSVLQVGGGMESWGVGEMMVGWRVCVWVNGGGRVGQGAVGRGLI